MIFGLIVAVVAAVVAVVTAVVAYACLSKSRKDADENFGECPVGGTVQPCPLKDKKLIKVVWNPEEAWCSDNVSLLGTARNFDPNTKANAQISCEGKGNIDNLSGTGQNSFSLPWEVKDVPFKGNDMPEKYELKGKLTAAGQTVETKKLLQVKRVPDKDPEQVSIRRTSGRFGWTASFKIGVKKDKLNVTQTLQIKKAWLGKWVTFDSAQDGGVTGWSYIKKDGANWKYWNKTADPKAWAALPRGVSQYTVTNMIFVESGTKYVGRDDASKEWPEAFSEPANYETKKTAWLANIHSVWDNKFDLYHKDCKSATAKQCKWRIRVKVSWSDSAGDKLIYGVWAQEWERSNAKDWYLTENRAGVAAHEDGHLLGAYDEYTGGALDPATSKVENDSIMGQNLTKGIPRHLDGLRDEAKKKINSWITPTWDFEIKDA